jgi:RNA polymerase sigma factor (sigma-70 family)
LENRIGTVKPETTEELMDFHLVPSVDISSDKLQEYLNIMEEGNKLLKKWANYLYGRRKRRTFREQLFKGEIVAGRDIPIYDFGRIMAVRDIQDEMLRKYSKLITEKAKWWAIRQSDTIWTEVFDDLYQEANLAFLDALYGYLGECKGASFFTYTYRVIDRRLRRHFNNEKMQMIPQTGDGARKLLKKYDEFKQKCGRCGRYITFDDYVIEAELTDEQKLILTRALAYTVNESDFMRSHPVNFESLQENDFTAFEASKMVGPADEQLENQELIASIQKCVEMADLTPFQLELINSSHYHGWKADLARKYNVSRTRAGQVYNQAIEKVKQIYKQIQGE